MSQISNFVVTNYAGSNLTFSVLARSGGDRVPARWRMEDATVPSFCRPSIEQSARWNAKRDARHIDFKMVMPYYVPVQGVTDLYEVRSRMLANASFVIPSDVPDALIRDFRRFFLGAFHIGTSAQPGSTPVSDAISTGYAPA